MKADSLLLSFCELLISEVLGAMDTVMLSRHSDNGVAAVGVVNQNHHAFL